MTIASVNGPEATIIRGAWDPVSTNGPMAVRCAWLGDEARLGGFTLEGGATGAPGTWRPYGGGVLGSSSDTVLVFDSIVRNSQAGRGGGGAFVTFDRCKLLNNTATAYEGGGSFGVLAVNSLVRSNSASGVGGGAYSCSLLNCTVGENSARGGGGIYKDAATNSIVYYNLSVPYDAAFANWSNLRQLICYTCTYPLPSEVIPNPFPTVGIGNITVRSANPGRTAPGGHLAVYRSRQCTLRHRHRP